MKLTMLYTGPDHHSYFKEIDTGIETDHPLGKYSRQFPVSGMLFRESHGGMSFDWHTAPHAQYIIYLEGEVEIETSLGEKRIFKTGDVLFANDLTGKGHITRTLSQGKSIVVVTSE